MYFCRVIATNFSKPSSFASTITREQTTLDDPHGVFQRDRGGKCNNYQAIDLIVQDEQGNPVSLDYFVDLECALRVVMEDGSYGGVIDTVTRSSKRISSKHLEGQSGKLMVVDADPTTGSGIRIGGSSRTTVKVRINELSKKGSKNSRYSVCFRAIGPGSEAFCQDEDPRLCSTFPLTIYSKVVKTSNYLANAAANAAASTTPAVTAMGEDDATQQKDNSDNDMEEDQQPQALPFPSPPTSTKQPLSATGSSPLLSTSGGSVSTAASSSVISDLEQIKTILDQVLHQFNSSDQNVKAPSVCEIQVLNSINETCNGIQRKIEARIQRANPPVPTQQQQLLSQLDKDLMAKIPLNTFPSMDASWLSQAASNSNGNASSWMSNPANASAIHAMFTSTTTAQQQQQHSLPSTAVPAEEHNQEKRLRLSPESSVFQKFLNSMPTFSTAFTSLTGGEVQQLQQQQQQHVLRKHASSSTGSVGFEELKNFLDAKAENILASASAGGNFDREGVGMLFSALQYPVTDEICDWIMAKFDANKDQTISLADVKLGVQAREEELGKLYATLQAQQPHVELVVLKQAKLDPALLEGSKMEELLQSKKDNRSDNRLIGVDDFVSLSMDSLRWNAAQALLTRYKE